MQNKELDLMDLILEILLHWRMLIIWMLIGMAILTSYSYFSSWKMSNDQSAGVGDVSQRSEELEMQAKSQLSDTQVDNVEFVLECEELYYERLVYQKQSPLLQMNALKVQESLVTFQIISDNPDKNSEIVSCYARILGDDSLAQYVSDKTGVSGSNAAELISLVQSGEELRAVEGNADFVIRVIHSDKDTCINMTQAIIEYVNSKQGEVEQKCGSFRLAVADQSLEEVYDANLLNMQTNFSSHLVNMETLIIYMKNNFSDEENEYYNILIDKISGKIVEQNVVVSPGISKMHVFLGAVIAAFIYVVYIFVTYVLNNKIRLTDDLQQTCGISLLGQIAEYKSNKKILGFIDEWILSIRYRKKKKLSREESFKLVVAAIELSVTKNSIDSVLLIGNGVNERIGEVCEQLKKELEQIKIKTNFLSDILYDPQDMCALTNGAGAVLVGQAGLTGYDEIEQELALLNRQEIKILGGVVVN